MISSADPGLGAAAVGLSAAAGWLMPATSRPVHRRLERSAPAPPWSRCIERVRTVPRPRWLPRAILVALAAAVTAVAAVALVPAAVAALGGIILVKRLRAARRTRAKRNQRAEDVGALRALAAELRCGLPPALALRAVSASPTPASGIRGRMLAAAAAESLAGDPVDVLLRDADPGSPVASLAAAWAVCRSTGSRLAAPVSRIANGASAELRIAREAESALAAARSSARLLAVLPFAGVALGALSGTGSLRVLLTTGIGQLCLLVGVALDLAGLAWLDRLADSAGA